MTSILGGERGIPKADESTDKLHKWDNDKLGKGQTPKKHKNFAPITYEWLKPKQFNHSPANTKEFLKPVLRVSHLMFLLGM